MKVNQFRVKQSSDSPSKYCRPERDQPEFEYYDSENYYEDNDEDSDAYKEI